MQKFIIGTASDVEDTINSFLRDGWVVKDMRLTGPGDGMAVRSNVVVAVVLQRDI